MVGVDVVIEACPERRISITDPAFGDAKVVSGVGVGVGVGVSIGV